MATFTSEQINTMIENNKKICVAAWIGGEMNVRHNVDLKTMMEIINTTVEACFDELGTYLPEVRKPVMWACVVEKYTDIELPDDIESKANLFIYTDIIDSIMKHIDIEQIHEIEDAINKRIENSTNAGNNVLAHGLMNTYASISAIYNELENAIKQIGDVEPQKLFKASGSITEEADS